MNATAEVVVLGQAGRDLVLCLDELPAAGGSAPVIERQELLGGKGANQAVGLSQLGAAVALVAVVGADPAGRAALEQAQADGIDVSAVADRGRTALLVDVVEPGGRRRLLEHVPPESLLAVADVDAAARLIEHARAVCLQLQQPADAMLAAARRARAAGARVVLDGAAPGEAGRQLLALADVLRADDVEAGMWADAPVRDRAGAERVVDALLAAGPSVVAVAVPDAGDLVGWPGGRRFLPHEPGPVVDPTDAGDAFLAGLVTGLDAGLDPAAAAGLAARAAGSTVRHAGGRPDLGPLAARRWRAGGVRTR